MHRTDRERQQASPGDTPAKTWPPRRGEQCGSAEHDPEQQGTGHQRRRPTYAAAQQQCDHADIVHSRDADADNGATKQRVSSPPADGGDPQSTPGDRHGNRQRHQGFRNVVASREACRKRQYGNEVGGPYAEADSVNTIVNRSFCQSAGRCWRYRADSQQADPGESGERAQDGGHRHEPKVVSR